MSQFDIFGISESALLLRTKRQSVLANNMANASTPNFKARDFDFAAALKDVQAQRQSGLSMNQTHPGHLSGGVQGAVEAHMMYRQPTQPSLDGNTVETHIEKAKIMENDLYMRSTIEFMNSRIKKLKGAIKGQF